MPTAIYRRNLPHIYLPGAVYFLTFRLATNQPTPLSDHERDIVAEHICRMKPGRIRAFVVMPDHIHLIHESTPDENLTATLQALKSVSAHRIAKQGGRAAPIWQAETYDHVIRTNEELIETWKYVEGNPVRRGMVNVPEAYRWSSAWGRQ